MKGNRRRRDVKGIDILSDLPDGMLHHILSFLDSESVVRSSILSRRWRWVWKDVPVLNFYRRSSEANLKPEGFALHVRQVLRHRSDCSVSKIGIYFNIQSHKSLFVWVMKYAASHGIQQLSVLRKEENDCFHISSKDVASITTCYQSLKVLELQRAVLDKSALGLWSRLKMLETLTLRDCLFDFDGMDDLLDPFADFPRLENLKLFDCYSRSKNSICGLRISGLQLLTLEIHWSSFPALEIFAPKLVSFSYWREVIICILPPQVSKLNLPSLNHATIILSGYKDLFDWEFCNDDQKQLVLKQCAYLIHGLQNVKSLCLHFDTIELLIRAYDLVKHQPSPFKRLKSLSLLYSEGSSLLPYQVIRYFLEGSPNLEDAFVKFERAPIPNPMSMMSS